MTSPSTAFQTINNTLSTKAPFLVNLGRTKPSYFYTIRIVIWLTTSLVSIFGNSVVIAVSARNRGNIGVCRTLIAHLAFCDLVYGLFQIGSVVSRIERNDSWLGVAGCKTIETVLFLMTTLSCWTIVVIAIERYKGIVYPLHPKWGKKKMMIVLGIMWLCSCLSVAPLLLVSNYSSPLQKCYEEWGIDDAQGYATFLFIINCAVPFLLLVILYSRIVVAIRTPTALQGSADTSSVQTEFAAKRKREEHRIFKLLLIMVIFYFVLVTPDNLVRLIVIYQGIQSLSITTEHFFFFFAMAFSIHICINPFLYSTVDKKFRKDSIRLLRLNRCYRWAKSFQTTSTSSSERRTSSTSSTTQLRGQRPSVATAVTKV